MVGKWTWHASDVILLLAILGYMIVQLEAIVVPFLMALLLTAFLSALVSVALVGGIVTRVLATLVAMVCVAPVQSLIMLGSVLLVHLLEAHMVQPLAMGATVKVSRWLLFLR